MRRRLLATICLAALGTPAAWRATMAAPAGGAVRIGIVNDQTGPLSDLAGLGSVVAARLAVEDFQRKAPEIKVEILSADHQNKPDVGAQIVRRWFDVDGVDAIFDVGNSAVALAVQSIARERNKLAFYAAVGTTEITGRQCSPTGFAWLHGADNLVTVPIRKLVAQGADTWFFIAADYEFGRNMVSESQQVLAAAGGKSVGTAFHPLGNVDFSSFLLQAQASRAKVVAFANAGAQLVNAMKQWQEFGMASSAQTPVALLMFLTDVHSMGPDTAQGITTLTAWYWDLNDETRQFAARFYQVHGSMPTEAQASMYSATLHYLRAVAAAGTDATGPVLERLRATPVDDFYAPGATIRPDGRLFHDFYLVQAKKPSEVKRAWAYYEILQKVPAADAYPPLGDSACPLIPRK